jgi:glyoxylase-like metal-dependent hydrolase (beta-lactamase superfamily II)
MSFTRLICCCLLLLSCASRAKRFEPPKTIGVTGLLSVENQFVELYGFPLGDGVILIDTGVDAEAHGVDALLSRLQRSREQVSAIFLTHGHGDHTGAVPVFPNAKVYGGKADAALFDGSYESPKRLSRWLSKSFKGKPFTLSNGLEGRQEIPLGGGAETVLAIPFAGHTPGTYLYLFRGVLFTGDTIQLKKERLLPAPKMFHADTKKNLQAIIELPVTLSGLRVEQICTGHWGCTPFGKTQGLIEGLVKEAQNNLSELK